MSHNQIGTVNGDGSFNPYGSTVGDIVSANNVTYDNTTSGLSATDVQDAIDEMNGKITELHQLHNSGGYGNPDGGYIKNGRMVVGSTYIRLYNNYVQGMSICRADDKPIYIVAIRILNSTMGAYYDGIIDIDGHFRIGANIDTNANIYISFAYVTT